MDLGEKDFPRLFIRAVGKPCQQTVPLHEHSNFRIGGPADYFFEALSLEDIVRSVCFAANCGLPYCVIGGGYNLLFDDKGFRGLVIKNRAQGLKLSSKMTVEVASGTPLQDLVRYSAEKGLAGLEFLAGIPGTVGGAVFGNAGAFGQEIGDILHDAWILDGDRREKKIERGDLAFSYRQSRLKRTHEVLLRASFSVKEGDPQEIKKRVAAHLKQREMKHPPAGVACAGSYFKNPLLPGGIKTPAASLLEKIGAKSLRIGGAAVHPAHANFLVNFGEASAQDVISLAAELKRRVKKEFQIDLEEEVIFLPASLSKP